MSNPRIPVWILWGLVPVGLLFLLGAILVVVSLTPDPLHPEPASVPSATHSDVPPKWAEVVENARDSTRTAVVENNLPGLSVAVGINGELVWAEGFGFADLKTSTPVTPEHRFRIGTASTLFTSAAAGLLLENGQLRLDEEIQRYAPAFPKKQWPVSLRHLMANTAGIINDGGDEGPLFGQHCEQPSEALPFFAEAPLRFEPGTRYRYSSYGWILVSTAIEAAAGQPFTAFMREQLFAPLDMHDTVPDDARMEEGEDFPLVNLYRELIRDPEARRGTAPVSAQAPKDRVTQYFPKAAADPVYGLHLMRPLDYSCYAGASVFLSTPSDLVRFGMAMNGGKFLQPSTVDLLQTTQQLASGEDTGYGLGWAVETVTLAGKPTRMVGQNGDSLGGMVASLWTFPEHGIVVAVTSNISYADTKSIALKIAESVATVPGTVHSIPKLSQPHSARTARNNSATPGQARRAALR